MIDAKFLRGLVTTQKKLISGDMQVSQVVDQKASYEKFANEVLNMKRDNIPIPKEIKDKLEVFLKICLDVYTYSENGDVLISDWTYDEVMNLYCKLFNCERLVYSDYIASRTIWPFVKHEAPFMVGTIDRKVYDTDDLKDWLHYAKSCDYDRILYAPKFDGISVCITLRNGHIERAVTRNDGIEGQDITEVIRKMNRVKRIFNIEMPDGYYKCEIVVTTADYTELVKLKPYANRRSAASAIISSPSNLPYAEFITTILLAWVNFDGTRMKYLAWQHVEEYVVAPNSFHVADVYDNIMRILEHIRSPEYQVRVDGVVLFPVHTHEDEPNTTDLLASAMAYKVNTQESRTRIKEVYMSVGRTGLAKPMARVEAVEVNETIVRNVSLGSMWIFSSMALHEQEDVIVYSAGDVIPQLKLPEPRRYPRNAKIMTVDIACPYCGKKMKYRSNNKADLYCLNAKCPRVLSGRIVNFLDKLDIAEGFRDATFMSLVQDKIIYTIEDLFDLHTKREQVIKCLNSTIEADKLLTGLEELRTKEFDTSMVLGALGIPGFGIKKFKLILSDITLDYLLSMKKGSIFATLLTVPGISGTTAHTLSDWLNENRDFLDFLMEHMKIREDKITYGNVVFTGFRNKDYAAILKDIGFPENGGINKDTVAVVYAGDPTSGTAKKAIDRKIPLIHVADIDDLITELESKAAMLETTRVEYGKASLLRDIRDSVPIYVPKEDIEISLV